MDTATAIALPVALVSTILTNVAYLIEHDAAGGAPEALASPADPLGEAAGREPGVAQGLRARERRLQPLRRRRRPRVARARAERRRRRYRRARRRRRARARPVADTARDLGSLACGRGPLRARRLAHRRQRVGRQRLDRGDPPLARRLRRSRSDRRRRRPRGRLPRGGGRHRGRNLLLDRRRLDEGRDTGRHARPLRDHDHRGLCARHGAPADRLPERRRADGRRASRRC